MMRQKKQSVYNKKVIKILEEVREDNPYPLDIFVSDLTQDGRMGKFGFKVWNNCLDKIIERLKEL